MLRRTTCFAFDETLLVKNNEERTFEMAKAEKYLKTFETILECNLDENICPEMHKAMLQAKTKFANMWPEEHNEYTTSEFLFKIYALSSRVRVLERDLREAHQEIEVLKLSLEKRKYSPEDALKSSIDTSGCLYDEETMSCNPVPGMNTILLCAEKKKAISNENSPPALTVNLRGRVDAIQQMFGNCSTTCVDQTTMVGDTKAEASLPLILAPSYAPPSRQHLKIHPDPVLLVPPPSTASGGAATLQTNCNSKGLQIYRDPDRANTTEDCGMMFNPPFSSTSMFPRPGLTEKPSSVFPENDTLDFNPPSASTAIFAHPLNLPRKPMELSMAFNQPSTSTVAFNPPFASTAMFQRPDAISASYVEALKLKNDITCPVKKSPLKSLDNDSSCEMQFSPPKHTPVISNIILDAFNTIPSPMADRALRPDHTAFLDIFLKGKKDALFDNFENKPPS